MDWQLKIQYFAYSRKNFEIRHSERLQYTNIPSLRYAYTIVQYVINWSRFLLDGVFVDHPNGKSRLSSWLSHTRGAHVTSNPFSQPRNYLHPALISYFRSLTSIFDQYSFVVVKRKTYVYPTGSVKSAVDSYNFNVQIKISI